MAAERFIPFRKQYIIQMCSQELLDEQSELSFTQFRLLLSSVIHIDYHEVLESLKNNYALFEYRVVLAFPLNAKGAITNH